MLAPPKMGPGRPGEMRVGPDGKRYRWVLGVGAGGKRRGFWRRLRPRARFQRPARTPGSAPGDASASSTCWSRRTTTAGGRPAASGSPSSNASCHSPRRPPSLIPGIGPAVAAGLTVADASAEKGGDRRARASARSTRHRTEPSMPCTDSPTTICDGLYEYRRHRTVSSQTTSSTDLQTWSEIEGAADDDVAGMSEDDYGPGVTGVEDLDGYVLDDRDNRNEGRLQAYVPEPPRKTRMAQPSPAADIWKPNW